MKGNCKMTCDYCKSEVQANCARGHTYNAELNLCYPCPIGTFKDTVGRAACTQCPAGVEGNVIGAEGPEQCKVGADCLPGFQSSTGSVECHPCPKGTFKDTAGVSTCTPCPDGQTTDGEGSDRSGDCKECKDAYTDDTTTCGKWQAVGYCAKNHIYAPWMRENCEKTCGFCGTEETATALSLNLALGAPTRQSSELKRVDWRGESGRAVDGNTNPHYFDGKSCTHTDRQNYPWWEVDLGTETEVKTVVVYTRQDCCKFRIGGVAIAVSNEQLTPGSDGTALDGFTRCTVSNTLPTPKMTLNCDSGATGRYVYLYLPRARFSLVLCEVEVFGTKQDA